MKTPEIEVPKKWAFRHDTENASECFGVNRIFNDLLFDSVRESMKSEDTLSGVSEEVLNKLQPTTAGDLLWAGIVIGTLAQREKMKQDIISKLGL